MAKVTLGKRGLGEKWGEGKSEGRRREAEKEFAHLDFLGAVHPSFIWIYLAFLEANNNNVISILPKSPPPPVSRLLSAQHLAQAGGECL